jgi:hypothetical protein
MTDAQVTMRGDDAQPQQTAKTGTGAHKRTKMKLGVVILRTIA